MGKTMKVCLDLTPALHNTAGTGRYVRELAKALVDLGHEDRLSFFCVDPEGGVWAGTPGSVPRKSIRCSKRGWSAAAALSSYLGYPHGPSSWGRPTCSTPRGTFFPGCGPPPRS